METIRFFIKVWPLAYLKLPKLTFIRNPVLLRASSVSAVIALHRGRPYLIELLDNQPTLTSAIRLFRRSPFLLHLLVGNPR